MRTRIASQGWRLCALGLALCLAACGTGPAATQVAASPTIEPSAAPSATRPAATNTAAPTSAPPTVTLTAVLPTNTAPPATVHAGPAATAAPDPAVATVLAYLDARARADVSAVTALSCKAWKPKAVTEAVSFRSMNAKLIDVTCQVSGSAGSFTLVGCGGKMHTTYGAETRDWDLSAFVYQVTAEDGQWKMCGYH